MGKCPKCGAEKGWMEYSGVWVCPEGCDDKVYAIRSLMRLGFNLSKNHQNIQLVPKDKLPKGRRLGLCELFDFDAKVGDSVED